MTPLSAKVIHQWTNKKIIRFGMRERMREGEREKGSE
jgi:hypothetical protein